MELSAVEGGIWGEEYNQKRKHKKWVKIDLESFKFTLVLTGENPFAQDAPLVI